MAKHNIKEAARLAGVNRTTLYTYMKEGRISWETLPNGNRVIDTAELSRVFGTLQSLNTNSILVLHSLIILSATSGLLRGMDILPHVHSLLP